MRGSQGVSHAGYEKRGEWEFFDGNPRLYMRSLLRDANKYHSDPAGRLLKRPSKREFDRFVTSQGGQVAATLAFVTNGNASVVGSASKRPLERFLRELAHGHYFCKPDDGMGGVDAFHLENSAAGVKIGGMDADRAQLAAKLSTRAYLIQEWLVPRQHGDIARFNPSVINAIRLGTFESERGPIVLTAFLKAAIRSPSVDNWSAGGVIVSIDRRKGALVGNGILKHGYETIPAHPVSGVVFDGAPIPHFAEAVTLVQSLHAKLRAKTLGWDIALLEHGPVVLECNFPGWDYSAPALLDPAFTATFLAFHLTSPSRTMLFEFSGNFPDRDPVREFICKVLGRSGLSGRLESLSQKEFTLTVAGTPGALAYFIKHLKLPRNRALYGDARWQTSSGRIRPGLDLYASFSEK